MHMEQATLVNAQGHLYKGTRQNMLVTKHNNVDKTFWIFYFLCVFRFFLHKNKKRFIKNYNVKTFKANANKQNNFQHKLAKSTQSSIVTKHMKC